MSARLALALVCAALLPLRASAQAPQVVWKTPAEGAFDLQRASPLSDDGASSGDATAGDGLFTGALALPADADPVSPRIIEYRVLPPGADLAGSLGADDGGPMILDLPDGQARTVTVFYSTARDPAEPLTAGCPDVDTVLSCKGFLPIPGLSDDWNLRGPLAVVGDHQPDFGGAAWDPASPHAALTSGRLSLLTPRGFSAAQWKVAAADGRLGSGGWSFAAPSPAGGFALASPGWRVITFEVRPQRGMARVVSSETGVSPPLISEVSLDPAAPFVELHNPAAAPLSLGGLALGDTPLYFRAAEAPAVDPGDGAWALPEGAVLPAGGYLTVALGDAAAFQTTLGVAPDLFALAPAWSGSVGVSPSLLAAGEMLALFQRADRVRDLDLLVWGSPAAGEEAPLKSGVVVGTQTHGEDSGVVNASPAPAATHLARQDVAEGGERQAATYNGVLVAGLAHDETDEPLSQTWAASRAPTPGAPTTAFAFQVGGTVTEDGSGAPLEGVSVRAEPPGEGTLTSSDGRYVLLLGSGSTTLTATRAGYHPASQTLAVSGDTQADFVLVPDVGVRVLGRIERETGAPLAGARVVLDDGTTQPTQTSDEGGAFTFSGVLPGAYTVRGSMTGFRGASRSITVADADVQVVLVLQPIPAGYEVSGRVRDAADDAPIAGATLQIAAADLLAVTDEAGGFVFRLVPPGTWSMQVVATGYAPQLVEVVVAAQPVTGLAIALARATDALSLRGRVRVANLDLPVRGAQVRLTPEGSADLVTTTSNTGDYVFAGLAAGAYGFSVNAPGYVTASADLALTASAVRDVELERAPGQGFALGGRVQLADASEGAWQGSTVTIDGPVQDTRTTAADGTFSRPDLPPGVYRVTASRAGYLGAAVAVTVTGDTNQDFILRPEAEGEDPVGCACASRATGPGALPLLATALILLRRRRRI